MEAILFYLKFKFLNQRREKGREWVVKVSDIMGMGNKEGELMETYLKSVTVGAVSRGSKSA
jgi:hypothetical protein